MQNRPVSGAQRRNAGRWRKHRHRARRRFNQVSVPLPRPRPQSRRLHKVRPAVVNDKGPIGQIVAIRFPYLLHSLPGDNSFPMQANIHFRRSRQIRQAFGRTPSDLPGTEVRSPALVTGAMASRDG